MGHRQSTSHGQREKGPVEIVVESAASVDKRPTLKVPGTGYRVMYVDPTLRSDVVGPSGYVALEHIPARRRQSIASSMKRERENSVVVGDTGAQGESREEDGAAKKTRRTEDGGAEAKSGAIDLTTANDPFFGRMETVEEAGARRSSQLSVNSHNGELDGERRNANRERREDGGTSSSDSGDDVGVKARARHNSMSVSAGVTTDAFAIPREFIRPVGVCTVDRVFFRDKKTPKDFRNFHASLHSRAYELEEDEVHEMAGVHRVTPRRVTVVRKEEEEHAAENSFEVKSAILDALRLAIEAPMKDMDIGAFAGETVESEELKKFRDAAMQEAKQLFALAQEESGNYFGASLRSPRGSEAAINRAIPLISTEAPPEEQAGRTAVAVAAEGERPPSAQVPGDEKSAKELKALIKRRKALHKEINSWKEAFMEATGREASQFDLSNDPTVKDVYFEYIRLKKITSTSRGEEGGTGTMGETAGTGLEGTGGIAEAAGGTLFGETAASLLTVTQVVAGELPVVTPSPNAGRLEPIQPRDALQRLHTPLERASKSPAGSAPATPAPGKGLDKAQKKQLKKLTKIVKQFKADFKEQHNRNPTRIELIQSEISDEYEEYRQLKEIEEAAAAEEAAANTTGEAAAEGEGGGEAQPGAFREGYTAFQEDGGWDSYQQAAISPAPVQQLTLEELVEHMFAIDQEEEIERRNLRADEDFEWRRLATQIIAMELPTLSKRRGSFGARHSLIPPAGGEEAATMAAAASGGGGVEELAMGMTTRQAEDLTAVTSVSGGLEGEAPPAAAAATKPTPVEPLALSADATTVAVAEANPFAQFRRPKKILKNTGWGAAGEENANDPLERRREIVQQLNDWREQWRGAHGGEEPVYKDLKAIEEMFSLYQELATLPENGDIDFKIEQVATNKAVALSPTADPKALAKRRKELGKELNAWKATFAAANGREPTTKDIRADAAIASIYEEYSKIPKDVGKTVSVEVPVSEANPVLAVTSADGEAPNGLQAARSTANLNAAPSAYNITTGFSSYGLTAAASSSATLLASGEDAKVLAKRRKMLGKELNAWKADFAMNNGREPAASDVQNDPKASSLYAEYSKIPKDIGKSAEGGDRPRSRERETPEVTAAHMATAAEPPAVAVTSGSTPPPQQQQPENGAAGPQPAFLQPADSAAVTIGKNVPSFLREISPEIAGAPSGEAAAQSSASAAPAPMPPEEAPDTAALAAVIATAAAHDPKALAKHRKQLGKELSEWKKRFTEENGRGPTVSELRADPKMGPIYDEYQSIPKDGGGGDAHASGAPAAEAPSHRESTTPGAAEEHPPQAAAPAAAADATAPPTLPAVVAAVEATPAVEVKAPTPPPAVQVASSDPRNAAKRKKQLGRELNDWKVRFFEQTGRKPKAEDIERDPEAAPLYHEYVSLKSVGEESREPSAEPPVSAPSPSAEGGEHVPAITVGGAANRPPLGATAATPDAGMHAAPAISVEQVAEDPTDPEAMARKRKRLGKELNAWKAVFQEKTGRAATGKDIKAEPDVFALYQEYTRLGKAGTGGGGGVEATGSVPTDEAGSAIAPSAGPNDNSGALNAAPSNAAPNEAGSAEKQPEINTTSADEERMLAIKQRRKELTKELNAWKEAFIAAHGSNPKASDMKQEPSVYALFEELNALKATVAA